MLLEAVPNFSEGCDPATLAALGEALALHSRVLDLHADADHDRCVFTVVGRPDELVEALVAAARVALERIDLRAKDGVHPRIGVADVLPLVPLEPQHMAAARVAATALARRLARDLGLPVFLYGACAGGLRPSHFRRGGLAGLRQRVSAGELAPDFGPPLIDLQHGACLVGARPPLVAFNVNLATLDIEVARAIAAVVREAGGGFPGVRALGLVLRRAGCVQVSMNIEDWQASPPHVVVARIREEAARHGVAVLGSELVGLLPAGAAALAAAGPLALPGLAPDRILESRALGA
jgi:glutamate formiminotransferase